MNDREMAPITRHLPVHSGFDGRRTRNGNRFGGTTYAFDPIRSHDGAACIPSEVGQFNRIGYSGRGRAKVMRWFKDRPYLLPYIAVVVTIELIVTIIQGGH